MLLGVKADATSRAVNLHALSPYAITNRILVEIVKRPRERVQVQHLVLPVTEVMVVEGVAQRTLIPPLRRVGEGIHIDVGKALAIQLVPGSCGREVLSQVRDNHVDDLAPVGFADVAKANRLVIGKAGRIVDKVGAHPTKV